MTQDTTDLIERLRDHARRWTDSGICLEAATALAALQADNVLLRNASEEYMVNSMRRSDQLEVMQPRVEKAEAENERLLIGMATICHELADGDETSAYQTAQSFALKEPAP